jgi:FtsP/CotA-like multicopper oxidase with cupredoxin domain
MRSHAKLPLNRQLYPSRSKMTRRRFLGLAGLGAGAMILGACEATQRSAPSQGQNGARIAGYALEVAPLNFELGGREVSSWGYNGGVPGPEIRLKEGDTLRAAVRNRLPEGTTIHWHGLPIPNEMDGVPDVTQPPIGSGEDFTYEFEVPVSGTFFYHSHVGLQLDRAVYGPLVIEPESEPLGYDREFTLMLDDWLDGVDGTPEEKLKSLKTGGSAMSGMDGMDMGGMDMGHGGGMEGMDGMEGMGGTGETPRQWRPDIVYPSYLINGNPPDSPEELRVKRGEKVRIRFINSASASIFRVALAGHRMTVTHSDGQPVEPVEADALRIGQGERYDVFVDAGNPGVWQLAARAEGTEKIGRALFRYEGSSTSVPPANQMPPELERELLLYDMLRAAPEAEAPPGGEPDEVVPITINGDEEKYVWTINGEIFSEADPIPVGRNKHIRFELENKSMMPHPMHLHGHFFRVENGTGQGPMKDTVLLDPRQKLTIDWLSDNPGDWAFHCHMIYHQEAGMMRVVKIA